MFYIHVPDLNDSISTLSIDGREYNLRFTFNEKYNYWSFGVYDSKKNPLVAMTRLVPNFPLLHYYTDTDLPNGAFGCISDKEEVGRNAFKDATAEFVYIPYSEMGGLDA